MNETILLQIAQRYQQTLESSVENYPTGTCYLAGYCLAEYFNGIGIPAKSVTGELAIVDKNGKYAVYGNMKIKKSTSVGYYHTWCEVLVNDKWFIVDPSMKYNKTFLKSSMNFKASVKIPDIVITPNKTTFNWQYIENKALNSLSDKYLAMASNQIKEAIITSLKEGFPPNVNAGE